MFDPVVDSYEEIAINLVKGNGYSLPNNEGLSCREKEDWPEQPTALRAPAYPLFLYQLYRVTNINRMLALVMQAIFDTGTCFLIYLIAQRLFASRFVSHMSSLLWACYFPGILVNIKLYSEPIFTFLLAGTVLLIMKAHEKEQLKYFAAGGVGFAIATLCRPVILLFPLVWAVIFMLRKKTARAVRNTLFMLFAYVLTLTPWTIRNYQQFDQFIPGSTRGGYSLYSGNATLCDADFFKYLSPWEVDERVKENLDETLTDPHIRLEGLIDNALLKKSFKHISNHPLKYIALCLNRFFLLWFNVGLGIEVGLWSVVYAVLSLFLLAMALDTIIKARPWPDSHYLIWSLAGFVSLVFMLTESQWRFTLPLTPYILIFSSAYLVRSGIISTPQ
jgi:4-amino-4-deoxy-L-arabinose transferase-like glycosyltransferase